MIVFDRVFAVDWSARGTPSPAKPTKDAIFVGRVARGRTDVNYHRTRQAAIAALEVELDAALAAGERVWLGFDFAFGYPSGFATALTGSSDPFAVWDWLAARICDDAQNTNNRFDIAAQMNAALPGTGPFWGHPAGRAYPGLPERGSKRANHGFEEKREVEKAVRSAQPVWKLFTTGAVGSQTLLGLPYLARLRRRYGSDLSVWPFETRDAPIRLVEIYPSLPGIPMVGTDDILDARQVRSVAEWVAGMSPEMLEAAFAAPEIAREEGWIFGAGLARPGA